MARKKTDATPVAPSAEASGAEYTVVARRYRPQQFGELVGQDAIAQALSNALTSNRVAHAYLFTGARGVGKTSTARILAKCLNCVKGPTLTPCDECELCKAITAGEDVDVIEIDGASNNKVEEIREIRSNVQYRPQRGRYKIYIIDEVHMLSTSAFNALLKTLEEPPPHVKFIFATTEVNKIPITILSRCQRFDFSGISLTQIRERLKQIVEREGMEADEEALEIISRRAGGSMRDGQSLLDQLLAFGGDRLTIERVHQLLGTAHEERIIAIAGAVLEKDAARALAQVADAAERGLQLGELLDQLIDYWRDLMVVQAAGIENQTLSVTGANKGVLQQQAGSMSPETILAGLDILVTAKNRLRTTTHGRIVLEMALVRLARLDHLVGVSQLVQWLQEGGGPAAPASSGPRVSMASAAVDAEKKKLTAEPVAPVGPIPLTQQSLPVVWEQLLSQAGFMLTHELRRVISQAISGPNALVLRIPSGYNLFDGGRKSQIEALLTKITGQEWAVKLDQIAEAGGHAAVAAPSETATQRRRRVQDELLKQPLVARAKEVLGASVIESEEGFGLVLATKKADEPTADDDDFTGEDVGFGNDE